MAQPWESYTPDGDMPCEQIFRELHEQRNRGVDRAWSYLATNVGGAGQADRTTALNDARRVLGNATVNSLINVQEAHGGNAASDALGLPSNWMPPGFWMALDSTGQQRYYFMMKTGNKPPPGEWIHLPAIDPSASFCSTINPNHE